MENYVNSSKVILKETSIDQAPTDELSFDERSGNHCNMASGQSSHPKDACSLFSSKVSGVDEMLDMNQNAFDCQEDSISCISKHNVGVIATSERICGANHTNVTSDAASVNRLLPEVMEKSCNDHFSTNSSIKAHKDLSAAVLLRKDSSDRSDPSENSILRSGPDNAILEKHVPFECVKEEVGSLATNMADSNSTHHAVTEEIHDLLRPEAGLSETNMPVTDSSRRSDENDYSSSNTPVADTQDPLLPGNTMSHGSEDLVDVRVCDICGDAGREALLALCSTCSDGAEHIYCMRKKMDEVPGNDWMCEECIGMQEPKSQTQAVVERADNALNPNCLKELSQPLTKKCSIQQTGEPSAKHSSTSFKLSGKKRTFEESIHPPKSPCRGSKTRMTCVSSIKSVDKRISVALPESSLGDRPAGRGLEAACLIGHKSLKSEKRSFKGSQYKSKTDGISELNMKAHQSKGDILPTIATAKESTNTILEQRIQKTQLLKSSSFAGAVSSDVPNPHFSHIPKVNGLKCASERDITENVHVPEKKTNRLRLSPARSCSMKVRSSRMNEISETAKAKAMCFSNKKAIQANGHNKVESSSPVPQEGKKHTNKSGGSAGEKLLHPLKTMASLVPSNIIRVSSPVPAAECIWKGEFKLEKSGKLPSYCGGVQAHLSNCALSEVHEIVTKFGSKLLFKELARSETRPYFRKFCPNEEDIAFYFFAENLHSYERSYKMLLDGMMINDLVLEANFDGMQLLVFPSNLLPTTSQRWNSLFYLWGVCRVTKAGGHSSNLPGMDVATLNQDACATITYESKNKCVSMVEAGSLSTSQTLHKSVQEPNAVHPLPLKSSALTKSSDQSCDRDTSSMQCLGEREGSDVQTSVVKSLPDLNEVISIGGELHADYKLKGILSDDRDIEYTAKTAIFPVDQSNRENRVSLAIDNKGKSFTEESCRGLSASQVYHPASESSSRRDIASRSSFSFDSGPSWSSDGCVRSGEACREQSVKLSSSSTLNLDLCLGFNSLTEEEIDLNLALGFPATNRDDNYSENRNSRGSNVSLNLSLGLPGSKE